MDVPCSADGRHIHDMYLFQVKKPEESTKDWDYYTYLATIPGDEAFVKALKESGLNAIVELKKEEEGVFVSRTGCQGFCQIGPLVTVLPENIFYTKVKPGDVAEIVETTIRKGDVVERLLYVEPDSQRVCRTKDEIPFYRKQHRFALSNCGAIDPESGAPAMTEREARAAGLDPEVVAVTYGWRRLPPAAQRALQRLDRPLGERPRAARFGHTLMLVARR